MTGKTTRDKSIKSSNHSRGRSRSSIRQILAIALIVCLAVVMQMRASAQIFNDVPTDHWAFSFIETLANSGVTAGCGNDHFCPTAPVTRAQMAVLMERGIHGSDFNPPLASGNVFRDVSAESFAASFIEQFFFDGITAGCGSNNYCPDAEVTRDQMAVFLLRAKHGAGYSPPAASGVFNDVPLNYWTVHWIEQLAAEGITAGCGNDNYCPKAVMTRDQMVVFLARTFGVIVNASGQGSVTLSWTIPSTNEDGTPLTDLGGFKIYYGASPGNYADPTIIDNPGISTLVIDNLSFNNTYFFAVTAVDEFGNESEFSNETSKAIYIPR